MFIAGAWRPLDVNGATASINVGRADYPPDPLDPDTPDDVVLLPREELAVIRVGGVERTDEWIRFGQ